MKLTALILDLLYPPRCIFCGRILERGEVDICPRCQQSLPWTGETPGKADLCEACLSPLWYRGSVRRAMHRFKFGHREGYSTLMGEWMYQCVHDRWSQPLDAIVWVPLSDRSLKKRGYDQAELLARRVGELSGLPVIHAMKKIRHTATQSLIDKDAQRRANVLGAYEVRSDVDLSGLNILLVDDIVTSGATVSECAYCLKLAGAASIVALTFARSK